jgi:5-formyltetrahydrofolate cyclo-ligase
MIDKPSQRQQIRQQRCLLSAAEQHHAALALATRLAKQAFYQRAETIAAYLPNDGEISPLPLLHHAQRLGKSIYLPVLEGSMLRFVRYRPGLTPLHRNRLGIFEPYPQARQRIETTRLDLVLLPLVAFDADGNRLGMGGGFYDRSFAFKNSLPPVARPVLVGIAHHLQKVARLTVNHWDIPMDTIATDRALHTVRGNRR